MDWICQLNYSAFSCKACVATSSCLLFEKGMLKKTVWINYEHAQIFQSGHAHNSCSRVSWAILIIFIFTQKSSIFKNWVSNSLTLFSVFFKFSCYLFSCSSYSYMKSVITTYWKITPYHYSPTTKVPKQGFLGWPAAPLSIKCDETSKEIHLVLCSDLKQRQTCCFCNSGFILMKNSTWVYVWFMVLALLNEIYGGFTSLVMCSKMSMWCFKSQVAQSGFCYLFLISGVQFRSLQLNSINKIQILFCISVCLWTEFEKYDNVNWIKTI